MTRVEYRLAAARYFLQLLHSKKPKPPEFDWLVEAVISTARTATWLMKAEAHNSATFQEWDKLTVPDTETAALFKKIREIRDRISKVEPARTREVVKAHLSSPPQELQAMMQAGEQFRVWESPDGKRRIFESMDGLHRVEAENVVAYQSLDEFPAENVLDVCERYIAVLDAGYRSWLAFAQERLAGPT
jgi:hypothetical protein